MGGEIRSCRGAIGLGGIEKTTNCYVKPTTRGGPTRACSRLFVVSSSKRLMYIVRQ